MAFEHGSFAAGARGSAARQRRWAGGGDSGRNGAKTIGYEHGKRI